MNDKFKIHYWVGGYSKQWKEHSVVRKGRGIVPWEDTLPKTSVILCGFELDENSKLLQSTRRYLKKCYKEQKKKA